MSDNDSLVCIFCIGIVGLIIAGNYILSNASTLLAALPGILYWGIILILSCAILWQGYHIVKNP
ncbi:MAG: hypothetical protein LUQ31_11235 [Methanoregula sp.]|nr:hypothetical protein [Methanoregula sp.]